MDIKIEGADKLVRNIAKRVDRSRVNAVIRKNTADIQEKAQRFVPVDTGFMKRSITMAVSEAHMEGRVTVGAEYGPYVEFGTRFNGGAQPFMRPARNEQAPIFLSDMKNLIRKG